MKNFLWYCIFFVLIACENPQSLSQRDPEKPDSIISRSRMIQILTDVHLAEAASVYMNTRGDKMKDFSDDYYQAVFSKFKISKKRFTSNFDNYKRDQEDLIRMYDQVIKNLEANKSSGKPNQ